MPSRSFAVPRFQLAAVFAVLLLCACSSGPQLRDYKVSGRATELQDVPYFDQAGPQDAASTVAMLIGASNAPALPQQVAPLVQDPQSGQVGTAAVRAAPAHFGRVGYVLRSRELDLEVVRQLQAGHAVLVLLHSGVVLKQWRYALAIGVDPASNVFILRGPGERRREMSYGDLVAAWKDSGYWAMLSLRPGDIPENADAAEWIGDAAQMEQAGKVEAALQAYSAVTQRWPKEGLAWLGLGRDYYALHNVRGATIAYYNATRLLPNSAAAHNGLAQALVDRQCADQAEDEAKLALNLERDPQLRAQYLRTQKQVQDYGGPSVVCPLE